MSDYLAYVMDCLKSIGGISARAMFGGHGLYCRSQIFALIADGELYFKVGDHNRADYEAVGSEPFTYEGKGKTITMSYWKLPEDVLADAPELKRWVERSLAVKPSAKPKKRKAA